MCKAAERQGDKTVPRGHGNIHGKNQAPCLHSHNDQVSETHVVQIEYRMMNENPGEKHTTIKITSFSGAQNIFVTLMAQTMLFIMYMTMYIVKSLTFLCNLISQENIIMVRGGDFV